jgi:hypothetical protein
MRTLVAGCHGSDLQEGAFWHVPDGARESLLPPSIQQEVVLTLVSINQFSGL